MKLLIIQTGDATTSARNWGNDWFKQAVPHIPAQTVHVHQGELLPDVNLAQEQFSHLIITGSAAMVTEQQGWMLNTQRWLESCIESMPVLGVCFGHQLLADLLGGKVSYNPKGRNMGQSTCYLTAEGQQDSLFNNQKAAIDTWVSHLQAVEQLPQSAVNLGACDKDNNHAFRYGKYCYGVQFHPEWNRQIMLSYIQDRREDLLKEGFDCGEMVLNDAPSNQGVALIKGFIAL